jgi:chromosome partitioning protein
MSTVYSVVNQKGGVGKTTTAVNIAAGLALMGRRVLLVDLDPQGNACSGLGIRRSQLKETCAPTLYEVLLEDAPISTAVCPTPVPGLGIVPSTLDLAGAELELVQKFSRETVLKRALEPVRSAFDFILIDSPPSLGLLTINGLTAADAVIVPIQCEYYALEGVAQLTRIVSLVREQLNPSLRIAKVILTMFDNRVRLAGEVADEVRKVFGETVSATVVPRNVRLSEAPSHGLPVCMYDSRSRGARAYRQLAEEVAQDGSSRVG